MQPSVWDTGMFLSDNHWKFWTFSIHELWYKFSGKRKSFSKNGVAFFSWKYWDWKRTLFIQNCSVRSQCKKSRVGSTKWTYHKRTKFFQVTTLFFRKFCFSLRTSYKKLIQCTNHQNARIHTFRKRWSFIWE